MNKSITINKILSHGISKVFFTLIFLISFFTNTAIAQVGYAELKDGTLTFKYGDKPEGAFDINNGVYALEWNYSASSITKVVFDDSFAACHPTTCSYWFKDCSNLTEIVGIKNLKTDQVTFMHCMFIDCSNLTNLDLSEFDTKNVTDMSNMFNGCSSLTTLDVSGFDTQNVEDMHHMFYNCSSLTTLDLSGFDTKNVTNMYQMFYGCSGLTTLDVSGFDTKNVNDMRNMFCQCSSITKLDLSGFDTQNVTSMLNMFFGCSGLTSLDLSGFDTRNVTNMNGMFSDCSALITLDVSGFDTKNVKSMINMFGHCSSLTSLDLSKFDTQNVTNMSAMFNYCSGLATLDVSGFNTQNVTNMYGMFCGCSSLTTLDLSIFDTHNLTEMTNMFYGCSSLTTLDVSGFDTKDVTNMNSMFYGCSGLTTLDVSGFDTQNVTDMSSMFRKCSNLITILVSNYWNMSNVSSPQYMFIDCSSLKGGNGTKFDANYTDGQYAKIDKDGQAGYFTYKKAQAISLAKNRNIVYTGKAQPLISSSVSNLGVPLFSLDGVTYSKAIPTATNVGEYTVYYKVDGNESLTGFAAKSVKINITKAQNKLTTMPEALSNLIYNGKEQAILTKGVSTFGNVIYSLDGKTYSETIPNVTIAGEYTVYYKVDVSDNYDGIDVETVKVEISKAQNKLTTTPKATSNLIGNGKEQTLITEGKSTFGKILYSLDGTTFSETIPSAIYPGEYTVYYKVEDTDNYDGIGTKNLTVTIIDNNIAYAVLKKGTVTFYYKDSKPNGALPLRNESDDNNWNSNLRTSITKVVFDESFKDYRTFKTSYWFLGFSNLTEISGMENINTDNLEYMNEMFQFCDNLKSVDLSGFTTEKVTDMTRLFWGCNNLEYVIVGNGWNTSALKKSTGMFEDCFKLHGGKGTAYNSDYTDATYARVDGGAETPGYFTKAGDLIFKKSAVSIEITTSPKIEYTENDDFSAENGKLTIKYNDNTSKIIDLSAATITGYDKTKTGEQTLKIEYEGVETSLQVTVKEKTTTPISDISTQSILVWSANHTIFISNAPADTEYKIIDLNGRVITTSKTKSTREEINVNNTGVLIVIIGNQSFKLAL